MKICVQNVITLNNNVDQALNDHHMGTSGIDWYRNRFPPYDRERAIKDSQSEMIKLNEVMRSWCIPVDDEATDLYLLYCTDQCDRKIFLVVEALEGKQRQLKSWPAGNLI